MPTSTAERIHPTAQIHDSARIDPSATIGPEVTIEPDVIVGPHCSIGAGTILRARAIIVSHTTMGAQNDVHPYAVLGGDPQDRAYSPDKPGALVIGDRNIFREGVTISRSTGDGPVTTIGDDCFFMSQSHAAHNCRVANRVTLANGACLAGYSEVADGCVFSGFTGTHQFTRVGELVMFRAGARVGMHVPPFVVVADGNLIGGLNVIGLRRAGFNAQEREDLKAVYRALLRDRGATPMHTVIQQLESDQEWSRAARRFLDFFTESLALTGRHARGICPARTRYSAEHHNDHD